MLNIFQCARQPRICLLWNNVFSDLPPISGLFVFLILSCMSFLYILALSPLSIVSYRLEYCLLFSRWSFFVDHFLCYAKAFKVNQSYLCVFGFLPFALACGSKKNCYDLCHQNVLPMFQNLMVSGLTLRSLIYLEFVFVQDVEKCFNLIILHAIVQFWIF